MNSFTLLALFALVFAAVVVPVSANDDDDAACNVANTNSIFDECIVRSLLFHLGETPPDR